MEQNILRYLENGFATKETGDKNLIAITPMSEGSGMKEFAEKYPKNFLM